MKKRTVIASAFAAALAAPIFLVAQKASGAPPYKTEKCYGIARAGKNDCAVQGANSCSGTSKVDGDPKAWMNVPVGLCERIVNGSTSSK